MGIVTTAFAPIDNNHEKGGLTFKIDLERCGGMVKARRDTYKQVYKPDGQYHYPKIPEY